MKGSVTSLTVTSPRMMPSGSTYVTGVPTAGGPSWAVVTERATERDEERDEDDSRHATLHREVLLDPAPALAVKAYRPVEVEPVSAAV